MNDNQFTHALSLTRCRGKAAQAARLHLVDGLSQTDAAKQLGGAVDHGTICVKDVIEMVPPVII